MKDKVVLFHENCSDGFSGAWVARRKFGNDASYVGVSDHHAFPEGLEDKEVYLIDFSYTKEATEELLKIVKSLTIIDHHVSVEDVVKSVPDHLYALDKSGASLAWQYFFPEEETPMFIQYVEDTDLWNFNLPQAEDFFALGETLEYDFDRWDKLVEDFENEQKRQLHLDYGNNIRQYQEKIIDGLIDRAEEVELDGYSALAINSPIFRSQAGNAAIKKGYDIGIVWAHSGYSIKVSLRSEKDGKVDVSQIAQKYGGGGHQSSAAFILHNETDIPWHPKN